MHEKDDAKDFLLMNHLIQDDDNFSIQLLTLTAERHQDKS